MDGHFKSECLLAESCTTIPDKCTSSVITRSSEKTGVVEILVTAVYEVLTHDLKRFSVVELDFVVLWSPQTQQED